MSRRSRRMGRPERSPANDLAPLIYWKNEARRLAMRNRELSDIVRLFTRDRIILWKAWHALTNGEHESILKLASGLSDDEFLEWLSTQPAV